MLRQIIIELNATACKPEFLEGFLFERMISFGGEVRLQITDMYTLYTAYQIGPALRLLVVIVGGS